MSGKLTFGSLFAGIGGFDLGFERAGLTCRWQVEINTYAKRVLAKHWPDVVRWDDVHTWPQPNTERVDCIVGGFPCQDISYAGPGSGLRGARSGLWFEYARIIRQMEPRFVVVENVAALLTRGLDQVLGTLASLGYDAEWDCVPACSFGAPHIRDRIWILGWNTNRNDENSVETIRSRQDSQPSRISADELDQPGVLAHTDRPRKLQPERGEQEQRGRSRDCCSQVSDTDGQRLPIRHESGGIVTPHIDSRSRSEIERIRTTIGRGQWEAEPRVGRVVDGVPHRVDRIRGLGNAVVPQVAEWIGNRVIEKAIAGMAS